MRSLSSVLFWLTSVIYLFSTVPEAHAEHGSPLLLIKPGNGAEIPRNAHIRLVSYNGVDELIYLLGRSPHKVRVRLESVSSSVRLRPVRYLPDFDGYGRAMISLAPRRLLAPCTEYRLAAEVSSTGWREELASFVTTDQVDRAAPRWTSRPAYNDAERTFFGRLNDYDDIVEVGFTVRPQAGGRARRTFILFDLAQKCIEGPTVDFNVAIFNSQCIDAEERNLKNAICDTLYYFPPWRPEGAVYDVTIELRDLAGNVCRMRKPAARIEIDEPLGLCLETPEASPSTSYQTVTFSGTVQRGENVVFPFSDRFSFELVPIDHGWYITIRDPRDADEDLARLTPPFHFVPNPRFIGGWHFRNKDNTGPNGPGEGNVNAPQYEREFIFSPKVGRSIQYPPTPDEVEIIKEDGRGVFKITELRLGNLKPGEQAHIESMRFELVLQFR